MVSIKAQILQAVEQMDDDIIFSVWDMLVRHFDIPNKKITWNDIVEVEPDEIDLGMIEEIKSDSDCHIYVSRDELVARRKARKC